MTRSVAERIADVRRLLDAARAVHARRADLAPAIAASTGLSPEGVELGFECLERDASDADLGALVAFAGDAPQVHVVLSANVFVAPLRALALARASAPAVTVRPSPRDPTLTRALVEALDDPAVRVVDERDVTRVERGEIHVYGRDATVAAVRASARPGVVVRGHGAGFGVAVASRLADVDAAAAALSRDVVLFDQGGCMSPRLALVEGAAARAEAFAGALGRQLAAWSRRVPRGAIGARELGEARVWRDTVAFAGRVFEGDDYAVGVVPDGPWSLAIAPGARHLGVVPVGDLASAAGGLSSVSKFVVVVGADAVEACRLTAPSHARLASLGAMQRPPLDGPVDLRDH